MKLRIVKKGGEGSGNFGHAGRPGKVGGSAEGSGGAGKVTPGKGSGNSFMDEHIWNSTFTKDDPGYWHGRADISLGNRSAADLTIRDIRKYLNAHISELTEDKIKPAWDPDADPVSWDQSGQVLTVNFDVYWDEDAEEDED